jgi:hypothetical protein
VKRQLTSVFLGLLFPLLAQAQFRAGAYLGTLVDDNTFNNYLQVSDRVTEVSLTGAYGWESDVSGLQLAYTGSLEYFSLLPGRSFQVHEGEMAYSYLAGEEGTTLLNAGVAFSLRNNHEEYRIFDHSQLALSAEVQSVLFDAIRLKGGYAFRAVSFSSLPDFAYVEHFTSLQCGITLPTRTTLILQGDLGFKKYTTPNTGVNLMSADSLGGGRRSSHSSLPGVTQFLGTVRIGQGIADGTGLSITGQYQLNLRKESRYLTFSDGIVTDDEFFDDHYGYEGPSLSVMLTQILPVDMRLRISGSLQRREYDDRPAFDLEGNELALQRIDTRTVYSFSLAKTFPLGLTVTLMYDRIANASNDLFYEYRNNALSLRLSVAY